MAFECPPLPYAHDALEPVIDAETMRIHHEKHHRGYVDKLNAATKGTPYEEVAIREFLRGLEDVEERVRESVRNNGGGHFNHSMFWRVMAPPSTRRSAPSGALLEAIDGAFGSVQDMQVEFGKAAKARFGSGWAWVCVDPDDGLRIVTTANQDTPFMPAQFGGQGPGYIPILGVDVWEHAYYLKHRNDRAAYLEAWWEVVDWDAVMENYARARTTSGAGQR